MRTLPQLLTVAQHLPLTHLYPLIHACTLEHDAAWLSLSCIDIQAAEINSSASSGAGVAGTCAAGA